MGGGGEKRIEKAETCWWGRDYIHCVIIQSSDVGVFVSCAVLQWWHNRGWTSLSPLCLLRGQLTMGRSAGGDPDPLIVLWQPWASQLEDRKQQNAACWPAHLPNYNRTPL